MSMRGLILSGALIGFLLAAGPVRADAIDGHWCFGAKSFEIDGATIRLSGGMETVGKYDRHGFEYVVPTGEPDAGIEIVMLLLNEETVRLQRGSVAPPEIWRRCKPIS
jgi:hypothetical protein